jgi:hypothetical protein
MVWFLPFLLALGITICLVWSADRYPGRGPANTCMYWSRPAQPRAFVSSVFHRSRRMRPGCCSLELDSEQSPS